MISLSSQDQGIITLSQQEYLPLLIESFLIDRRSQGLAPGSVHFYQKKLNYFVKFCEGQAVTQISQLNPDLIRRYILEIAETHNPGDEILTPDHEYGACDYTWDFVVRKSGARYIHQPIPLPAHAEEEIVEQFWLGVTPWTKVIYLSHIASPTALRLPVKQICQRARRAGILTIVDAAHSPGQIQVDLQALGADVVFGNGHKWMLNVKGSAFLYVRRELQYLIEPLIVSWGYNPTPETTTGSRFIDLLQWTGTKDPSAALTVPTAIQFMQDHHWDEVREECHQLLRQAIEKICRLTGMEPPYPLDSGF